MFEKTLTDVVKGIRASKRDTALYISQCIAEIKSEINSSDMHVKANALQKLTFLQMMGYSMNWASFPSIEVMSSPRFAHKRIGYLAAVSKRNAISIPKWRLSHSNELLLFIESRIHPRHGCYSTNDQFAQEGIEGCGWGRHAWSVRGGPCGELHIQHCDRGAR